MNDVAGEGVGIDADTNAATFLTRATAVELPEMPKRQLADRILDEILTLRRPRPVMLEMDEGSRTTASRDEAQVEAGSRARTRASDRRSAAAPARSWSKRRWRARSIPPLAKLSLSACASIATWG